MRSKSKNLFLSLSIATDFYAINGTDLYFKELTYFPEQIPKL